MKQSGSKIEKKALMLLIFNSLTFLGTLFFNYAAGTGIIGDRTVGKISNLYPTLITPAGYAFSIWGLIYLFLLAFVGYQWYGFFKNRNKDSLLPSGIWFSLSNIANAFWIVAWINEAIGLSILIMLILLFSLIKLVINLRLEVWDAPLRIIAFVWWPICIYIGWIILASVLNISVWLKSEEVLVSVFSQESWAVIVIAVATLIYLFLIYERNMREASMVGIWGFIAIAYNQWGIHDSIVIAAALGIVVLAVYSGYKAFQNWETLPHIKLKRKEF